MRRNRVSINPGLMSAALAAMWALSGCTTYEVVMPETVAGRACVDRCTAPRQVCVADAEFKARSSTSQCEHANSRVERRCEKIYVQDKDVERCEVVNGGASFCPTEVANTRHCEDAWKGCVVQCGARIIEH